MLGERDFYRILDSLPSWWRPLVVTLVLTGLGLDKLFELKPETLGHEAQAIRVKDMKSPNGVRVIYVAEGFWPYVLASVPVTVSRSFLRDLWNGAVERARLRKVRIVDLRRFRASLLAKAETKVNSRVIELLLSDSAGVPTTEMVRDRRSREEARLLGQLLGALALTEDEGRRLLLRRVRN